MLPRSADGLILPHFNPELCEVNKTIQVLKSPNVMLENK